MEAVDSRLLNQRQRVAWAMLLLAFSAFAVLVVTVPAGVRWAIQNFTVERDATVELIRGVALVLESEMARETSAIDRMPLGAGDVLRTPGDAQAMVSFVDGSNVRLWPNTRLAIIQTRQTRFTDRETFVGLRLDEGHARFEVALPMTQSREFRVDLPTVGSSVYLREGSYSIFVNAEQAEVVVRQGSASIVAGSQAVELLRQERIVLQPDAPLGARLPAERNLIQNSDFADGLTGWQASNRDLEDNVAGTVTVREEDARKLVRVERKGSNKHGETFLHQALGIDVTDFQSLRLQADVRVHDQTLSGGGWVGTEYPVLFRLKYRDSNGAEAMWQRGYYIQNDDGHPTPYGQQIRPAEWFRMQVDLFDPAIVQPRPAELLWFEIVASGWGYRSDVANVQLKAE